MNQNEYIIKLEDLYSQVPSFKCLRNCTDCCGPIFFSGLEASRFPMQYKPPKSTKCPYSVKGACGIYEVRPMVCRLFGAVNDQKLTCSFKCGPALRLDPDHARGLLIEVQKLSALAGFGSEPFQTHSAMFNSLISPSRVPIKLKGYKFNA